MFLNISAMANPVLVVTQSGNQLQFSWDNGFGTFKLQTQTNSLNLGVSSIWSDYPGGGLSPVTVPIDPAQVAIFFRLVSAP